jgi:hypothetical protein
MIRALAGLAAGLAVAIMTVMAIEGIGNQIYPPPPGYDMTSGSAETLPFETLIWPVIGYFLGDRPLRPGRDHSEPRPHHPSDLGDRRRRHRAAAGRLARPAAAARKTE